MAVAVSRSSVSKLTVSRLHRLDHFDDAGERLALGQVARPRLVHEGAEGVVELHGVDAHVDVRRAEAGRPQQPREHSDRALACRRRVRRSAVEQCQQRLDRGQVVAVDRVMTLAAFASVKPSLPMNFRALRLLFDGRDREVELAGDLAREPALLAVVAELGLADARKRSRMSPSAARFSFRRRRNERPLDVGAPVEVVADPRGECRQLGVSLYALSPNDVRRRGRSCRAART